MARTIILQALILTAAVAIVQAQVLGNQNSPFLKQQQQNTAALFRPPPFRAELASSSSTTKQQPSLFQASIVRQPQQQQQAFNSPTAGGIFKAAPFRKELASAGFLPQSQQQQQQSPPSTTTTTAQAPSFAATTTQNADQNAEQTSPASIDQQTTEAQNQNDQLQQQPEDIRTPSVTTVDIFRRKGIAGSQRKSNVFTLSQSTTFFSQQQRPQQQQQQNFGATTQAPTDTTTTQSGEETSTTSATPQQSQQAADSEQQQPDTTVVLQINDFPRNTAASAQNAHENQQQSSTSQGQQLPLGHEDVRRKQVTGFSRFRSSSSSSQQQHANNNSGQQQQQHQFGDFRGGHGSQQDSATTQEPISSTRTAGTEEDQTTPPAAHSAQQQQDGEQVSRQVDSFRYRGVGKWSAPQQQQQQQQRNFAATTQESADTTTQSAEETSTTSATTQQSQQPAGSEQQQQDTTVVPQLNDFRQNTAADSQPREQQSQFQQSSAVDDFRRKPVSGSSRFSASSSTQQYGNNFVGQQNNNGNLRNVAHTGEGQERQQQHVSNFRGVQGSRNGAFTSTQNAADEGQTTSSAEQQQNQDAGDFRRKPVSVGFSKASPAQKSTNFGQHQQGGNVHSSTFAVERGVGHTGRQRQQHQFDDFRSGQGSQRQDNAATQESTSATQNAAGQETSSSAVHSNSQQQRGTSSTGQTSKSRNFVSSSSTQQDPIEQQYNKAAQHQVQQDVRRFEQQLQQNDAVSGASQTPPVETNLQVELQQQQQQAVSYRFGASQWQRVDPRNESSDWKFYTAGNYTADGATILHDAENSIDLTGMPVSKWYPQHAGRHSVLSGNQAVLENKRAFNVSSSEQFTSQWRFSGRTFNTVDGPFPKNVVSKPEDDPRLGSVGVSLVTDVDSALEFSIVATNKGLWAVYSRAVTHLIEQPQTQKRDFAVFKRLGDRRSPFEVIDAAIQYDRTKNKVNYYVNNQLVWTVDNLGKLPAKEPASKLYTSNRADLAQVEPTSVTAAFGLLAFFDQYDPNNATSPLRPLRLTDDADFYDENAQFWDNESKQQNVLWGQGLTMTVNSAAFGVEPAGTELKNEAQQQQSLASRYNAALEQQQVILASNSDIIPQH